MRVALSELLLSGVTTLADLSMAHPGWLDLLAEAGMRVCIAPMFRSGRWYTKNGHMVEYAWDEAAGEKAMGEALSLIERAEQHPSGRLFGMVVPAQIDTCTEGLLRDSFAEAKARGVSWQIHAAQSVSEFHEITRRHGYTPIGWLDHLGLLSERSIIGHGIFLDDHPSTRWHTDTDVKRLAETGTTVAHCPDRVRPARHHAEGFRPLPPRRREHGRGHRHLSAQHARRDAPGRLSRAHPGRQSAHAELHRSVRGGHHRRRACARPRRYRPAGAGCRADIVLVDHHASDDAPVA